MPSSGSWLIKFCVVCGCVYAMWRHGAYRSADRHIRYTQPHTTQNFINQNPNWQGTDELPEDGTYLPKHVGAAK
jgi:hypothetical protein